MRDILALAVWANGGAHHWRTLSCFRARARVEGILWAMKGKRGVFRDIVVSGDTGDQCLTIAPYPGQGQRTTWEPRCQTTERYDGVMTAVRHDPRAAFAGHTRQTAWDDLHAAYFAADVLWNFLTLPFHLLRPGVRTETGHPWREEGSVWQSLRVTYPETIAAPSRQQTVYFDDEGLLQRIDLGFELLGPGPAVDHASRHRHFDGVIVPTRHRVHVRNPDGTPALESTSLAIDIEDAYFV
ncbi:hypothetical protein ACIQVK_41340 [Streptomyces sp. NPDC090493]|uniref:hypothetical protein n=1 Tax=Streptomyces sp. NPDC090493 TaxID=3365964 RepID=UPI003818AC93